MSDTLLLNKFRDLLFEQVEKLPQDVALCLSAGVDSIALLSLLLEAKKTVGIYSFTLDNYTSYDYTIAKTLSEISNCAFHSVILPTDIEILKSDVIRLHKEYKCITKTDYECFWPFLYVYPQVANHEKFIITGLGAEGHFGTTKKGSIHYKDDLDTFRTQFFNRANVSQTTQHTLISKNFDVTTYFPFLSHEIISLFMGSTWEDVNSPKLKYPVYKLISQKFLDTVKMKSSNLQLGSGIAHHFDSLLTTNWNKHNYKSIVGIFNSLNRGELYGTRKLI